MRKRLLPLIILTLFAIPVQAASLGDDGLHKEDWFTITFRDIREDIQTAAAEGKRLALIFEQRGCTYCKEVHEKVLSDPEVRDYIKANFMVVQYNLHGDEDVTDVDGTALSEKTAARKWGVVFTPTIMFMPVDVPAGGSVRDAAVAVMPGAFHKGTFLDFFTWVREQGYLREEDFQRYHARRIRERKAAGSANTD